MSDKKISLEVKYDSQKDLIVGISGMSIFAFFIPAAISLFLVFIGQVEAGDFTLALAKTFSVTINQISLVGSIVSLPIGLFGIYSLYLVATGKNQKVTTTEE
jgi:hypothetical protein